MFHTSLMVGQGMRTLMTTPPPTGTKTATGTAAARARSRSRSVAAQVQQAVVNDTWTKLSGNYATGDSRAGPNVNQGWTKSAFIPSMNAIFHSQGGGTNPNAGVFLFDLTGDSWRKTRSDGAITWDVVNHVMASGNWHWNGGGNAENYDVTYDPVNHCIWRTYPSPAFPGGKWGGIDEQTIAGPYAGDNKYDITTDEWSTPYPSGQCLFTPLPSDAGYFGTKGNCLNGFDSRLIYHNGALYQWGNYSVGGVQSLKRRDLLTGTITPLTVYPNVPPWTSPYRLAHLQGGINTRNKRLYTLADGAAVYEYDLLASPAPTNWTLIPTTGTKPNTPPSSSNLSYAGGDAGLLSVVDEATNTLVAWCGVAASVNEPATTVRKTWLLDLATRQWRDGPSLAAGHTVPTGNYAVSQSMLWDSVAKRTLLTVYNPNGGMHEVWALQIAPNGGVITSWPLPNYSGGVWGVNYNSFPYTANGNSKHTNMAHCPLDNRVYVSGGDMSPAGSANDGTWSMSLDDGSWRLEAGKPVYPTFPAPHAQQEGALFVWSASRQKFIFGFGGYVDYNVTGDAILNYSQGWWLFDPVAKTWEQKLSFFLNPGLIHDGTGSTGNQYGGVYDDVTDTVYVVGDGVYVSQGAQRYNLTTEVKDSTINIVIPASGITGFVQAVFSRGRQVKLGRYIYAIGYYSDGNTTVAGTHAAFWRYGIDDHTFVRLADPPAFTQAPADKELVLEVSNGKIVHPRRYGPEGEMPEGVYIYNLATNTWATDTKTPAYGAWIQNSICALPDGRVAMSGGVFGRQQTHMWFYEAT